MFFKNDIAVKKFVCRHGETKKPFKIMVLGKQCKFKRSPYCISCTEKYLNKFSTICHTCGWPILPGMPAGQLWDIDPKHFHVHVPISDDCFCGIVPCFGRWGKGEFIPMRDLAGKYAKLFSSKEFAVAEDLIVNNDMPAIFF